MGGGKSHGGGNVPGDKPRPAFAREQIDIGDAQNEGQEQQEGVDAGNFFQGANGEGAGALAGQVIEVAVAGEENRDSGVSEENDRPGQRPGEAWRADGGWWECFG